MSDATVIDGTGKTLIPGLIDSHTHTWGDALRTALAFGVTTELDMCTNADFLKAMKTEQAEGKANNRADLFSAGILGGTSTAEMTVVDGAMNVKGTIVGPLPYAWAGVMLSPGAQMFTPADLSSKRALRFRARGDGKTYRLMLFTATRGRTPLTRTFTAGPEWSEHSFEIASSDAKDVMAFVIAGGPVPGEFQLQIDDVRLE